MAVHQLEHRVIFGDTDAMGIVYHANYLRYFERARSEWFRELYKTPNQMIRDGNYMVVLKAVANYHCPARYDDVLFIETWVPAECIRAATIRFEYEIFRKVDGKLLVSGFTGHSFTHPDGRLKRMPREFVKALADLSENRRIGNDEKC